MGPLGMPELIVIFVIALLVFGPRKLPELGRSLGKSLGEFKRASNELRNTLEEEVRVEEQREATQRATAPAPADTPTGPRAVETPVVETPVVETRRSTRRRPSRAARRGRDDAAQRDGRLASQPAIWKPAASAWPSCPSPERPRRTTAIPTTTNRRAPTRCRSWSISTSSGSG